MRHSSDNKAQKEQYFNIMLLGGLSILMYFVQFGLLFLRESIGLPFPDFESSADVYVYIIQAWIIAMSLLVSVFGYINFEFGCGVKK